MIFLAEPNLSGNEKKYLDECVDTTFVSSVGKFVDRFENDIAKASEASFGTAVASGTAGLHMTLKAYGVQHNELVCIPTLTFIATANAVAHCGAEPWLIDIDSKSWTMNPDILADELKNKAYFKEGNLIHKKSGKRVAAIMPVYTMGMPADMHRLRKIANEYHLPLIADAAAAIGSQYKGMNIGKLADATVFSFNGNKTITCGGGGAIVGEDEKYIALAKHMATTARVGMEYDHDMVGYNYRMTNLQAAVGCAQLEQLSKFIDKKRYISNFYYQNLKDISGISFFPKVQWAESACWFSGIVLDDKHSVREMCDLLAEREIQTRPFWKPIYVQKPYKDVETSSIHISEDIWKRILTLPSSTGITDAELYYVVKCIREILN